MEKHHTFLESRIGLENLSWKQLEDIEFLVGSLNEHLESLFGCRIFYDKNIDQSTQEEIKESANNNIVNGFAVLIVEDEEIS
tara:strand:- start:31531 stop:31776 length:246 start_codon:yes stop_codon:yes gene_type:complete